MQEELFFLAYVFTSFFLLIDLTKKRIIDNHKVIFYQFLVVIPLVGPLAYYFKIIRKNHYSLFDYIGQIKCFQCGANNWSLIQKGNFLVAWILFLTGITLFILSGFYLFVKKAAVVAAISGAILFCYSRFILRCKKCKNLQEIKTVYRRERIE